ncbi:regulator [Vibrio fluvialis]|uniref:regulator n=1 Tax=Vibrio fluvialis TaxID=676 RepID=UPI002B4C0784|nr:regulator [Vibrio fluvialis]
MSDEWQGFKLVGSKLELPTGQTVTPQEILTGIGLLEIKSEREIDILKRLVKLARVIAKIKNEG